MKKPKRSDDKYWTGTREFDHIQYETDLEDYISELVETNYEPPTDGAKSDEEEPCSNCKENINPCACMRNECVKCKKPVGNITFSVCDECWDSEHPKLPKAARDGVTEEVIRKAFALGESWGVTYSTWFVPNEKQHEDKVKAAITLLTNLNGSNDKKE